MDICCYPCRLPSLCAGGRITVPSRRVQLSLVGAARAGGVWGRFLQQRCGHRRCPHLHEGCHPPDTQSPIAAEIATCAPLLSRSCCGCAAVAICISLWATETKSPDEWPECVAWIGLGGAGLLLILDFVIEELF